jgi:hypothetical protein
MFTPQPIGFVRTPYKETASVPKGLGAKHDAEGILHILPNSIWDSPTSKVFRISTCYGSSIAPANSN